jgi:hypothetical protein
MGKQDRFITLDCVRGDSVEEFTTLRKWVVSPGRFEFRSWLMKDGKRKHVIKLPISPN